jgi:hypothetical protein
MADVIDAEAKPRKSKKHHKNRHDLEAIENEIEQVYNNFCNLTVQFLEIL